MISGKSHEQKVYEQKNNQLLEDVKQYIDVANRDGYVKITSQSAFYSEDDLFKIISLVTEDGKFTAVKRDGFYVWDVTVNPNYEINKSVIKTNKSVNKTNNIQIGSIIITGLAIVGGVFFNGNLFVFKKNSLQHKKNKIPYKKRP